MRGLKISVGVAGLGFGCWAIAANAVAPVGAVAVLNAPVSVMRAPTGGLVKSLATPDALVQRGSIVVRIEGDLLVSSDSSDSGLVEVARLRKRIKELEKLYMQFDAQSKLYRAARVGSLESRLQEAEARIALAIAQRENAEIGAERSRKLMGTAASSQASIDASTLALKKAKAEERIALAQHQQTSRELAAARQGVFIGDGYNDIPASQQRRDEVAVQLTALRSDLARQQQLEGLADETDGGFMSFDDVTIPSPINGRVLSVSAAEGDVVSAGDVLAEVVDCSRPFVQVQLNKNDLDRLSVGAEATFVVPSTGTEYRGRLTHFMSSEEQGPVRRTARPDGSAPQGAVAYIRLQPNGDENCPVGKPGRVIFSSAGQAASAFPVKSALQYLGSMLGMGAATAKTASL